jgi:hypothetical protein
MTFTIKFLSANYHFFLVRSKYSPQCSQTSCLFSSLNLKDQVSHPHKTTDKINLFKKNVCWEQTRIQRVLIWMVVATTRIMKLTNLDYILV